MFKDWFECIIVLSKRQLCDYLASVSRTEGKCAGYHFCAPGDFVVCSSDSLSVSFCGALRERAAGNQMRGRGARPPFASAERQVATTALDCDFVKNCRERSPPSAAAARNSSPS